MADSLEIMTAEILLSLKQLEQQNKTLMQEVATLREELRRRLTTTEEWLDTSKAAQALQGVGVRSISHLRELLYRGVLSVESGEIRNTGTARKPNWQFNIPKCAEAVSYFYSLSEGTRDELYPRRAA